MQLRRPGLFTFSTKLKFLERRHAFDIITILIEEPNYLQENDDNMFQLTSAVKTMGQ